MKLNEVTLFILSDYRTWNLEHWQHRWSKHLANVELVNSIDWSLPVNEHYFKEIWQKELLNLIEKSEKPVIIMAHGLGATAAFHAFPYIIQATQNISGGFFVAPTIYEKDNLAEDTIPMQQNQQLDPHPDNLSLISSIPCHPLPFPSVLIASRNDPFCNYSAAEILAENLGSLFIDAGYSGSIDATSGHGPWPEGLMVFSKFLSHLQNNVKSSNS